MPSGARGSVDKWEHDVLVVKKNLLEVNRYARDKGIFLSIESPHVRTLTETIEEARRFYEMIGDTSIKCTLDTSHVRRLGDVQPTDAIDALGIDRINHVHLRDAVGEEIIFTPGKGTVDFKSFFEDMKRKKYNGDFVLELEFDDLRESQRFAELEFAVKYCTQLLDSGELSMINRIQTSGVGKLIQRIARDPKAEIKRHSRLLSVLKRVKDKIKPYMPEKVYVGNWKRTLRWRKNRVIRHEMNSVKLDVKANKSIRVGVVGCGWAGMEMHAPGFQRLDNVELVGAYDIDVAKTENFAKRYGVKPCKDLDDLIINVKPDLVSVCTREWAHHEIVMRAITNGVDVFCEKLLSTRYRDGVEMVKTATENNRIFGMNYNYHYMPGVKKLKEIIVQQALGKIVLLNINVHAFSYAHALDLLTFLCGKIKSVSAYYRNDNSIRQFGGTDWKLYDSDILYIPSIATSVTVEFENGCIGIVNSSYYYDLYAFVLSIESIFERGNVTLNGINMFNTLGILSYHAAGSVKKVDMNYRKGVYAKGYEYTFYESIKDFIECYIASKAPPTSGCKGLFNMKLERAIAESTIRHRKIDLNAAESLVYCE
jgi:predicted dehydrogenase